MLFHVSLMELQSETVSINKLRKHVVCAAKLPVVVRDKAKERVAKRDRTHLRRWFPTCTGRATSWRLINWFNFFFKFRTFGHAIVFRTSITIIRYSFSAKFLHVFRCGMATSVTRLVCVCVGGEAGEINSLGAVVCLDWEKFSLLCDNFFPY